MRKLAFLSIFAVAVSSGAYAVDDQHLGNEEVDAGLTTQEGASGSTDAGGTGGGGVSTTPPVEIAPSCPEEPDGIQDPRRGKPLCGQPPAPQCNNPAVACTMVMPAQKTFQNCAALIRHNATLVHFGRCERDRQEPEPQRLALGFEVKNFRQCVARVAIAKRLRPNVAPWLQADGKPMRTRDFCKRLFNPPVGEPDDATTTDADDTEGDGDGDAAGGE